MQKDYRCMTFFSLLFSYCASIVREYRYERGFSFDFQPINSFLACFVQSNFSLLAFLSWVGSDTFVNCTDTWIWLLPLIRRNWIHHSFRSSWIKYIHFANRRATIKIVKIHILRRPFSQWNNSFPHIIRRRETKRCQK